MQTVTFLLLLVLFFFLLAEVYYYQYAHVPSYVASLSTIVQGLCIVCVI